MKHTIRTIILLLTLMMGATGVWGQTDPVTVTTDTSSPVYYLFQSFGNTSFYMRPNGTKVNTSNILTDDMKWYFLESDESGYYYICDKDGNYLYFEKPSGSTSSRTWMELKNSLDNNDTEHYKFSIAKNNTQGWDAYNIIPYGNTGKYCLNKQGRNAGTGNVQISNGWDDENSNWVIIPMGDYVWTLRADCFSPSDPSNTYYYKIKSKADASYFIKPGTTYVETSNTVDDDMIWYFEEASSDDYMTYYYIRLANDGKYLRYRSTAGGQDNAIELASHTGSETGDAEDRFQFIVVRGAVSDEPWNTTDISYNIVPKLLKRTNNNINFFCVSSNQGLGKPLKTRNDRASTDNKWTFVSVDFPTICAKPTITFSNTTGKASITTTTTRSTIYYTTDGSEPSSSNGTVYTIPFAVNEQTTIKAFVTRTDFSDSEVTTKTINKVAAPTIQNTEASVISITSATSGAQIYYTTDGSEPTTSSTQYTEPVTITASSVTIKAIAVKDGMINSAVSSESFAFACATPTITFDNTTNTVTIASETGSTIYYAYGSTDPADPTVDDDVAHGSSPVTFTISAKTYIKALAVKEGLGNSAVQSVIIEKVSAPVIDVTGEGKVKLTSSTPGATIYYEIGDNASSVATPTTSSTRYTSPLSNVSGKVIKAIAVKEGWLTSDIGGSDGKIELQCAQPVIRRGSGNTISITCDFPAEGVSIYYTTDGTTPSYPTIVGTLYDKDHPEVMVNFPTTVKAIAVAEGYKNSSVATETITADLVQDDGYYLIASAGDFEKFVTMANSTGAGDKYKVVDNFTVSGNTTISTTFTGVFEGDFDDESGEFFTISGLRQPLFNTTNNAVIKNVILDNVIISSGTNVGAICGEATGDTRIYNCGVLDGSVGGSNNVGGIVGLLDGRSRVINCYNYAKVTSGSNCGGIVGYNNVASTSSNLQTMVMNCMFYGNIEGDNAAPIYGGANIHNKYASADDTGLNNYCYFLYDEEKNPYVKTIAPDNYHGALGAEERYLNRFEFFRMTLNSTRNVAAFYVTGDATQKGEMAKWVLDKSIAPYPILKVQGKYPSVVNPDAAHATTQTDRNKGGLLGTLSVSISGTGSGDVFSAPEGASITTTGSLTLNITDKDEDNFNYNYKKVQLPYYNEVGTGNYTKASATDETGRVVTGWKIVEINNSPTGTGTFVNSGTDAPAFNFVDRTCTNKDLYSVSGRVFAQGAYWEVPDGVTSITIEPYWAKAVYLTDANYDVTYSIKSGSTATTNKYGVTVCGSCPTVINEQTVYTDLSTAMTNLASDADHTVYDYAVVLVGNYHQAANDALVKDGKPVTFMSADLDGDNEPDNTLFYFHNQRRSVSPIRFDFLNIPGIGMVKRTYDATMDPEPGIFCPQGWFEITNSVFIRFGQFEYAGSVASSNQFLKTTLAPLILQGGIYEQFVSCCRTNAQNTNYLLIGGNAWFKNFANGCHTAQANKTPKVPINVTGGDYTNFYLTGIYQPATNEDAGNAECYIDGGRFTEVAGTGMQQLKGDVTWLINAADITSFYGGGINAAKPITGSISTTISNSHVDEFYGGPKFGDMNDGKEVITNATDCHFGKFFGAGYGGTAFNKVLPSNNYDSSSESNTRSWDSWVTAVYKRAYSSGNGGISTNYDYEFMLHSDGNQTVARFYVNYASLSLASTRNVTSTLTGCTIGTFYGGGSLGAVNGDVISTLTDCTITGNAFGAGFSASVPTVEVWNAGANLVPNPTYNRTANVFNNASVKTPKDNNQYVVYTWSKTHGTNASPFVDTEDGKHYIHTDVSLDGLGAVSGNVTLTLNGATTVGKSVYGGGEESGVDGTTNVFVTGGTIGAQGYGGVEYGNVFGGGKGKDDDVKAGLVKGNTNVEISGSPTIYHNVYGGGAYGSVGNFDYDTNNTITGTTGITTDATTGKLTSGLCTVKVIGGTIGTTGKENGMVFGSSRGAEGDPDVDSNIDKLAWVYDTEVVIGTQGSSSGPHIKGSVYGGGENGHNYHNASVTVHGGKIGLDATNDPDGGARYPYRGNVYGGGCGTDTYDRVVEVGGEEKTCTYYNFNAGIVRGRATVTVDGGHVVHNVYGAGAMGSVGTFTMLDYNDGGEGEAYHDAHPEVPEGKPYKCAENTGLCTVTISGGEIGENGMQMTAQGGPDDFGHVFGAGRGEVPKVRARLNEEVADSLCYPNLRMVGFVNKTELTISGSAFVKGSVYGGSESGHVLHDTWVKIVGGQIGCGEGQTAAYTDFASESLAGTAHWPYSNNGNPYDQYANADGDYPGVDRDEDGLPSAKGGLASATDGHTFYGNVFGGGSGYYPYAPGKWMRSSGWVEGNTIVEITGGHILNNVYGGCEMADVNGSATVNMSGGTVGVPRTTGEIVGNPTLGHVFGAGMGDKRIFFNTSTNVASTSVNISGGTVYGSVYGGGEDGHVMGNAETTISQAENKTTKIGTRGTVEGFDGNVFGGGQGSSTALTAGVVGGNVKLKIQGGTMLGSVYGGGRIASVGTFFAMASDERYGKMHYDDEGGTYESGTHGHLTIDLTGGTVNQDVYGGCMGTTENEQLGESKTVLLELNKDVDDDKKGCVVKGNIFGCNNVFSSPLGSVTVNIYGTQNADKSQIANTTASGNTPAVSDAKRMGKYDVKAVYGGGNMAAYVPTDAFSTNEDTKAAAHTFVNIYGCGRTSIQQVYGGGNAASTPATEVTVYGTYEIEELFGGGNGKDALPDGSANPGANVGFKNYSAVETDERWDTKEERETNADFIRDYVYGSGKASLNVYGGTIHRVFGGSNTKGNVRKTAITMLEDRSECEFNVDEAYGGGKSAPMDAEAQLLMACIPGLSVAYGGAEAADIQGGVTLNITNGKFDRIFGGNNKSGTIRGPIKINIEETGCRPIIIGELYGGGNLAGYSIYGYKDVDDEGRTVTDSNGKTMWFPRRTPTDGGTVAITPYANPEVNVKSFTSIGDIYGGGYGESAVMVGDPTVNINVVMGDKTNDDAAEIGENAVTHTENGYPIPSHAKGKIGAINNVFGGGNAAPVIGDTHVNIGTEPTVTYLTGDKAEHDVIGADIRGNVYGGGNAAEVTGSTHVTIGKQATTN